MRQKPSEAKPSSGGQEVLSVSRLASMIAGAVEREFPKSIRVVGEVSGARRSTHLYFSLKDDAALVGAVAFASSLRKMGFEPENGQQVVATGRLQFYQPQGRLTLIVDKLEPVGEGAHELRFRQLCEELRLLGWFDESRKRDVPTFPGSVAVITSRTGAALQDVLATMEARCPAVGVVLVPVRVQGEAAPREIVRAFGRLGALRRSHGVEACIVTRGGGSPEDLAAFNQREVAEAIVNAPIPVIAAIGHETDTTIAELVADLRCATPTQAAVRVTPDSEDLARQADALAGRLRAELARTLRFERQRLVGAARHPAISDPRRLVREASAGLSRERARLRAAGESAWRSAQARTSKLRLMVEQRRPDAILARAESEHAALAERLVRLARGSVAGSKARSESQLRQLRSIGPESVLSRGYSCTLAPDGTVVRKPGDAPVGTVTTTYLAEGALESVVERVSEHRIGEPRRSSPGMKKKAVPSRTNREQPEADQMDLFSTNE